jgi:hypothetical protein
LVLKADTTCPGEEPGRQAVRNAAIRQEMAEWRIMSVNWLKSNHGDDTAFKMPLVK